jgi:hypothetical protein
MTAAQYAELTRIFAEHGYPETVQVAHALDQDEYTLLIRSSRRADLSNPTLLSEAQRIIGDRVSIRFAEPA